MKVFGRASPPVPPHLVDRHDVQGRKSLLPGPLIMGCVFPARTPTTTTAIPGPSPIMPGRPLQQPQLPAAATVLLAMDVRVTPIPFILPSPLAVLLLVGAAACARARACACVCTCVCVCVCVNGCVGV